MQNVFLGYYDPDIYGEKPTYIHVHIQHFN